MAARVKMHACNLKGRTEPCPGFSGAISGRGHALRKRRAERRGSQLAAIPREGWRRAGLPMICFGHKERDRERENEHHLIIGMCVLSLESIGFKPICCGFDFTWASE